MSPPTNDIVDLIARAEGGDVDAQIILAFHYDGAGQSGDARRWMDAAAQSGAPAARLQRASWRLYATNYPEDAHAALNEIEAVANTDAVSVAPTFAAVLHATGLGVPRDWGKATHWLAHGAHEDEPRTLTQLALLQPDTGGGSRRAGLLLGRASALGFAPAMAALGDGPAPATPRQSRSLINEAAAAAQDPASWAPHGREVFCKRPHIDIFPYTAPALWRRYIIAAATPLLDPIRNRCAATIEPWAGDLIFYALSARIAAASGEALNRLEAPHIARYGPDEAGLARDEITNSSLCGQSARFKTAILYLNDDYTGGATSFPNAGAYKGNAGDLLIPHNAHANGEPNAKTLFADLLPSCGEKWVMMVPIHNKLRVDQHRRGES